MARKRNNGSLRKPVKKLFTYNLTCSFEMQFTFTASEVEQSDEGGEGDFSPTDEALESLEKELQEYIGQNYPVQKLEISGDFDDLLGTSNE